MKSDDYKVLYRSEIHENTNFLSIDPLSQEQQRTVQIEFQEEVGR